MVKVLEEFQRINLLRDVAPDHLQPLIENANIRQYPRGVVVVHYGDTTKSLFLVLEGRMRVYVDNEDGDEVLLAMLGPGDSFGELALFSDKPRTASVATVEKSRLAAISQEAFTDWINATPDAAYTVIRSLVERQRHMTEHISSLALLDVYGRIRKLLESRAVDSGNGRPTTDRLTHQEIGNMISASREMVTRILNDLRTGGYISIDRKRITIERKLPPGW